MSPCRPRHRTAPTGDRTLDFSHTNRRCYPLHSTTTNPRQFVGDDLCKQTQTSTSERLVHCRAYTAVVFCLAVQITLYVDVNDINFNFLFVFLFLLTGAFHRALSDESDDIMKIFPSAAPVCRDFVVSCFQVLATHQNIYRAVTSRQVLVKGFHIGQCCRDITIIYALPLPNVTA